jgi:hypothetical protein
VGHPSAPRAPRLRTMGPYHRSTRSAACLPNWLCICEVTKHGAEITRLPHRRRQSTFILGHGARTGRSLPPPRAESALRSARPHAHGAVVARSVSSRVEGTPAGTPRRSESAATSWHPGANVLPLIGRLDPNRRNKGISQSDLAACRGLGRKCRTAQTTTTPSVPAS